MDINGGGGYAVDLEEAAWTVTVNAFVLGTSGRDLEAAQGTGALMVSAANPNPSALITLAPLSMDGSAKGIFTWNINLSGLTGVAVTGTLTRVVDGNPGIVMALSGLTGSRELASGYYLLGISLDKEGKNAGVYRAVHIYPGLTTSGDFTFTDADFVEQKYLAGTVHIIGIPPGKRVTWAKVRPYWDSDFAVPLAEEVSVIQDGPWFFAITGSAEDVYFKVTMKLTDIDTEFSLDGGSVTGIAPEGRNGIALEATYGAKVTITFETDGGNPIEPYEVLAGSRVRETDFSTTKKDHSSFIGWYDAETDGSRVTWPLTVNDDITLYARWNPFVKYDVYPEKDEHGDISYSLEYSWSDAEYDYWYLYLGEVKGIPISRGPIMSYDGISPIVISHSVSVTNEIGYSNAVTESTEHTTGTSIGSSHTQSFEAAGGGEEFNIKGGYEHEWNRSNTQEDTIGHSNTHESWESWSTTIEDAYSVSIGGNGEAAGDYRATAFGTCNVFVGVSKSRINTSEPVHYIYDTFIKTNGETRWVVENDFSEPDVSQLLRFNSDWFDDLYRLPVDYPIEWFIVDLRDSIPLSRTITIPVSKTVPGKTVPVPVIGAYIKGTGANIPNMRIDAGSRTTDLRIIIDNLQFTAPNDQNAINVSFASDKTLTVTVRGSNVIQGGVGSDGGDSGNGTDGGKAISVGTFGTIHFAGNGTLELRGGSGGNGGIGAYCKNLITALISGGSIRIYGGNGGNGGKGGNLGNLYKGDGGDGGNGAYAVSADQPNSAISGITLVNGTGGQPGGGGSPSRGASGIGSTGGTGSTGSTPPTWYDRP